MLPTHSKKTQQLLKEAQTHHELAEMQFTNEARFPALKAGYALQKLRLRLPPMALRELLPIPPSAATRYIQLAEKYPTSNLCPKDKSLKELYRVLDAEKAAHRKSGHPKKKQNITLLEAITAVSKSCDGTSENLLGVIDVAGEINRVITFCERLSQGQIRPTAEDKSFAKEIDRLIEFSKHFDKDIIEGLGRTEAEMVTEEMDWAIKYLQELVSLCELADAVGREMDGVITYLKGLEMSDKTGAVSEQIGQVIKHLTNLRTLCEAATPGIQHEIGGTAEQLTSLRREFSGMQAG